MVLVIDVHVANYWMANNTIILKGVEDAHAQVLRINFIMSLPQPEATQVQSGESAASSPTRTNVKANNRPGRQANRALVESSIPPRRLPTACSQSAPAQPCRRRVNDDRKTRMSAQPVDTISHNPTRSLLK